MLNTGKRQYKQAVGTQRRVTVTASKFLRSHLKLCLLSTYTTTENLVLDQLIISLHKVLGLITILQHKIFTMGSNLTVFKTKS